MPNPYPIALRERAVRAYENGTDTYKEVAAQFSISVATLIRWVQRERETGSVARSWPNAVAGGRPSTSPCYTASSANGRTARPTS